MERQGHGSESAGELPGTLLTMFCYSLLDALDCIRQKRLCALPEQSLREMQMVSELFCHFKKRRLLYLWY